MNNFSKILYIMYFHRENNRSVSSIKATLEKVNSSDNNVRGGISPREFQKFLFKLSRQ